MDHSGKSEMCTPPLGCPHCLPALCLPCGAQAKCGWLSHQRDTTPGEHEAVWQGTGRTRRTGAEGACEGERHPDDFGAKARALGGCRERAHAYRYRCFG